MLMHLKSIAAIDGITFWIATIAMIVAFMVISSGDACGANSNSGNNKAPMHNYGGYWIVDVGFSPGTGPEDSKYANVLNNCYQACGVRNMGCAGLCFNGICDLSGPIHNHPTRLSSGDGTDASKRPVGINYGLGLCTDKLGLSASSTKEYCLCFDEKPLGELTN
jgi:hypothetical protein